MVILVSSFHNLFVKEQCIESLHGGEPDIDSLLAQVKKLAAGASNASRIKILDKLRDVGYSIETSGDTAKRLIYSVRSLIQRCDSLC